MKPAPTTQQELLTRAQQIAGLSFAELADEAGMTVPPDLRKDKGWVGQLLEWHLGRQQAVVHNKILNISGLS